MGLGKEGSIIILSISTLCFIYIFYNLYKLYKKFISQRNTNHIQQNVIQNPVNGTSVIGYQHPVIIPITSNTSQNGQQFIMNEEGERMLNTILQPTILNDDVNDMNITYINQIITTNPEDIIMPLDSLDEKYGYELCCICMDTLKVKSRPITKLSCGEHYLHYSCFKTLLEDSNKKKRVKFLFGEIKKINDMFTTECPQCRKEVYANSIFIKFPENIQNLRKISQTSIIMSDYSEPESDISDIVDDNKCLIMINPEEYNEHTTI